MDKGYLIRKLTPSPIRKLKRILRDRKTLREFEGLSISEKFNKIYSENWWGQYRDGTALDFDSGFTSYVDDIVNEYIQAIKKILNENREIQNVVDIGCGDFNVGSKIAPLFSRYVGIDVVESLIERNKKNFQTKSISFECKDITTDNLPITDLICVRQVLQHLSNSDIHKFLNNINGKCKFLLITETMHKSWRFRANKDIKTGPGVRYHLKSGVVLDAPPFNLSYKQKSLVCEPFFRNEHVVSTLYKF